MKKIAIINLWPTPYKDPIYRRFYELYNETYDVIVYYLNDHDAGHSYQTIEKRNYNSVIINKENNSNYRSFKFWNQAREFKQFFVNEFLVKKVDCVIVPGHGNSLCIGAIKAAETIHIPFIYAADTIANDTGNVLKKLLRSTITKRFLHRSKALWVPGAASKKYFISLGASTESIYEGLYCLDVDRLSGIAELLIADRINLRKKYGFNNKDFILFFAGRFLRVCNFEVMLTAFHEASQQNENLKLVLVGGGEESKRINDLINKLEIRNIEIMDFIPIEKIEGLYVASDAYYMTYDWAHYSLACIQAAICRKPIITTSTLGAAYDCVDDGINGIIIPPCSVLNAKEAILTLANFSEDRIGTMGEYSYKKVCNRNISWAANQLKNAIDHAIGGTTNERV